MDPTKQQKSFFALSMFSGVGNDTQGDEGDTRDVIADALTKASNAIGHWKIAWGPAVTYDAFGYPVHTMYVAKSEDDSWQYVIAIAGTSFSLEDQIDDLTVKEQVNWKSGGPSAMISSGTAIGLKSLLSMKPSGDRAGANSSLLEFLGAISIFQPKVTVAGHSLGGALAGTLALFLRDNQAVWDFSHRASVSAMTTAAPTAGNKDFADYSDKTLSSSLTRFANSFDFVPLAWDVSTLSAAPDLYASAGITDGFITWLIKNVVIPAVQDKNYHQVQASASPFQGKISPDNTTYIGQMGYQHVQGYWSTFGYDDSWTGYRNSPQKSAIVASAPAIRLALKAAGVPVPKELAAVGARRPPRRI